jgi:hypothetical protein
VLPVSAVETIYTGFAGSCPYRSFVVFEQARDRVVWAVPWERYARFVTVSNNTNIGPNPRGSSRIHKNRENIIGLWSGREGPKCSAVENADSDPSAEPDFTRRYLRNPVDRIVKQAVRRREGRKVLSVVAGDSSAQGRNPQITPAVLLHMLDLGLRKTVLDAQRPQ